MYKAIVTTFLICNHALALSNISTPELTKDNSAVISTSANKQAFEFPAAHNAWLRAAPPNVTMLAAYVTLENTTKQPLKLVGAYSPAFRMAEIHKSYIENGVAKMRHQEELSLDLGERLLMKPGGYHIMLMRPIRNIKEGEEVLICLIYEEDVAGKTIQHVQHINFPVKNATDVLE